MLPDRHDNQKKPTSHNFFLFFVKKLLFRATATQPKIPMTFDFPAHSLVSESNNDVVFLHKMLEEVSRLHSFCICDAYESMLCPQAEAADTLRKTEKAKSWVNISLSNHSISLLLISFGL